MVVYNVQNLPSNLQPKRLCENFYFALIWPTQIGRSIEISNYAQVRVFLHAIANITFHQQGWANLMLCTGSTARNFCVVATFATKISEHTISLTIWSECHYPIFWIADSSANFSFERVFGWNLKLISNFLGQTIIFFGTSSGFRDTFSRKTEKGKFLWWS